MDSTIKCKYCGKEIEISEALKHEIEGQVIAEEKERHEKELAAATAKATAQAIEKSRKDFEVRESNVQAENKEEKERSSGLIKQLAEMSGEMRALRRKDEERELATKKQIANEEGRIRAETRKEVSEEHSLKDREKDGKLGEALRQIEELKTKIQQGSQQSQGEVLEVELEEMLKLEFRDDEIIEVKKGQRGADVIQKVIDKKGRACGTILWEAKNGQWSEPWLAKLRQDQRDAKAQIAVLVVANPPADIETFVHRDSVWISRRLNAKGLALLLRYSLIALHNERTNQAGKDEKMESLYQYLSGVEFQHRVGAIVEGFTYLQGDLEREKRWFTTKWAKQEKEIRRIIDNTQGMHGDLQAVTGRTLPAIAGLELPAPNDEDIPK